MRRFRSVRARAAILFVLSVALLVPLAAAQGDPPQQLPGNTPCSFPPAAQKMAITGPVRFVAQVTPEGAVASVEILRAPWPDVGFEETVSDCVKQWRFEPAVGEAAPRRYAGVVRFRLASREEVAIRQLLEALARAWNARDQRAMEDLEVKPSEWLEWPPPGKQFIRRIVQAGEASDRWRLELEPDVTYLRFQNAYLADVRQSYVRVPTPEGPGTEGREQEAVLDLAAVRTPRGWRFAETSSTVWGRSTTPRVGQSAMIREPRKLKDVKPNYPEEAKQARVQGIVILECVISPEGKVNRIRVLRSLPLLDAAAIEAVRQWIYTPTLLNGQPVPVIMTVTVNFRLS